MPPAPRSRNGCVRCKSHRLKCDEATPVCGRCRRLGHNCSGPTMHLRWSRKHESSHSRTGAHPRDGALGPLPPPQLLPPTTAPAAAAASPATARPSAPSTSPTRHVVVAPAATSPRQQDLDDGLFAWSDLLWSSSSPPAVACLSASALLASSLSTPAFPFSGTSDSWVATSYGFPDEGATLFSLGTSQGGDIQAERVYRPLPDDASFLVKVYFEDVAPIMSIFDGNMNPFRSAVSRLWGSSELIYNALQSLAASFIAKRYPHMSSTGLALREKVATHVSALRDVDFDERALLCLLMMGSTSSWCDPDDLGLPWIQLFRQHMGRLITSGQLTGGNSSFFRGSLVSWEMLLSFIVDPGALGPSEIFSRGETADPLQWFSPDESSIFPLRPIPHPWTGVAREAYFRVEQVGRLVRSNRHRARVGQFTSQAVIIALQQELARAFQLEVALWAIKTPREADMTCPSDQNTPASHIHLIGEITRRVGLLQLYRVFPDILHRRANDLCITDDMDAPFPHTGASANTYPFGSRDHPAAGLWLTRFGLDTVKLLESLPADSGTCVCQLFLLVASCNELGPCGQDYESGNLDDAGCALGPQALSTTAEMLHARAFIISRLRAILLSLPQEPVLRGIKIVKATWERMDAPTKAGSLQLPPYWMDVMMENGWDTLMG